VSVDEADSTYRGIIEQPLHVSTGSGPTTPPRAIIAASSSSHRNTPLQELKDLPPVPNPFTDTAPPNDHPDPAPDSPTLKRKPKCSSLVPTTSKRPFVSDHPQSGPAFNSSDSLTEDGESDKNGRIFGPSGHNYEESKDGIMRDAN